MGLTVLEKLVKFFRIIAPIFAFLYLSTWLAQIVYPNIFNILDKFLGFLTSLFDSIIKVEAEFDDKKVTMGYVYSAIINLIFFAICSQLLKYFEKLEEIAEEKERGRKLYIESQIIKIKEQEKMRNILQKELLCGLFEFNLEYYDSYGKDITELDKLKFEYCKIVVNKLKTKYKQVKFIAKDKIFFITKDYNLLNSITKDILKIFDIFMKTGKSNRIATGLLLSYCSADNIENKLNIFKMLSQINKLEKINKIIITNEVYMKIQMLENNTWFDVMPVGKFNLLKVYDNDDIEVELYELSRLE